MTTTASAATVDASAASRRASLATTGAVLWTLSSVVWAISDLEAQEFGSLGFAAVAVAWWLSMVLAPALLVIGHVALRAALGRPLGKVAVGGIVLAAVGIGAMGLGIGIEIASMSVGGGEVAVGHAILLGGFLVSIVGGVVTGITLIRQRRDGLSRAAGWLLVLALPLGIGVGMLGSVIAPENDAFFWAALTLPTGVAWVLLGRSLVPSTSTVP